MTAQTKQRKTGRPPGTPTADRDVVDVPPSRCARCGCTERADYHEIKRITGCGNDPSGNPYTAVILRPTRCLNPKCGQHRIDRTWEYSAPETGEST